jgi:hypothetical protein
MATMAATAVPIAQRVARERDAASLALAGVGLTAPPLQASERCATR